jgi:hypothetical protein
MPWLQVQILLGPFGKQAATYSSPCDYEICSEPEVFPGNLLIELRLAAILERGKMQNLITDRDLLNHGNGTRDY